MDIARRSKQYSPQATRQLNYCRLYLHVTTVSELYDQTGTALLPHIVQCERPPWFDPATITVLQQRPTSRKCLQQWRAFCQHITRIVPSVGDWLPRRNTPLRLRRKTYRTNGSMPLMSANIGNANSQIQQGQNITLSILPSGHLPPRTHPFSALPGSVSQRICSVVHLQQKSPQRTPSTRPIFLLMSTLLLNHGKEPYYLTSSGQYPHSKIKCPRLTHSFSSPTGRPLNRNR